jgi:hypothetical protein
MIYIKDIGGNWIEGSPTENGQEYKEVFDNGGSVVARYSNPVLQSIYTTENEAITVNGNPTQGYSSVFFGKIGDAVTITMDLVNDSGEKQSQIDQTALCYPPILALPVVKLGSETVVIDEIYFESSVIEGTVTATGIIPSSGNWQLICKRVNDSLAEIGADWQIKRDNISFRVAG